MIKILTRNENVKNSTPPFRFNNQNESLKTKISQTEAVVPGCSSKFVLLKISWISQENNCVGVSF